MFLNQPVFQENKNYNFKIHLFSFLNTKQTVFFFEKRLGIILIWQKIFWNVRVRLLYYHFFLVGQNHMIISLHQSIQASNNGFKMAMYKTRNTETGNVMRRTRGMGRMLYSGECRQTLRGMSSNILGNVAKQKNFFFEVDTFTKYQILPELYSEPLQISKMDCFT